MTSEPAGGAPSRCALINFAVWGVCGGALCAFGYVGNTLSVVALQRDVRSPTTTLLQALAVSDLVLLVSVAVTDAAPYVCDYSELCVNPWRGWPHVRYVWLLTPLAHMSSIWLVVLVAANRYWAVCRPHAAARAWTTRRTVGYVAVVVVGVVAFNVPRLFEYSIEPVAAAAANFTANDTAVELQEQTGSRNVSAGSGNTFPEWTLREVKTSMGASAVYRVGYKVVFVNMILVLLPLVTLVVLSVFVIRTLRRTPSYRLSLVHTRPRLDPTPPPAAVPRPLPPLGDAAAAAAEQVAEDDLDEDEDAIVTEDGQQTSPAALHQLQQLQQLVNGEPDIAPGSPDVRRSKSTALRLSFARLKV